MDGFGCDAKWIEFSPQARPLTHTHNKVTLAYSRSRYLLACKVSMQTSLAQIIHTHTHARRVNVDDVERAHGIIESIKLGMKVISLQFPVWFVSKTKHFIYSSSPVELAPNRPNHNIDCWHLIHIFRRTIAGWLAGWMGVCGCVDCGRGEWSKRSEQRLLFGMVAGGREHLCRRSQNRLKGYNYICSSL